MQDNIRNRDKAGEDYWNRTERNQKIEFQPFAPIGGIRGFARRKWHNAFERAFKGGVGKNRKLLELGCGGSAYLPYFAQQFGYEVYGLDYSERGCELARRMCDAYGVSPRIICADFFNAPAEWLGSFDVVTSFGVVEHFTDTANTVRMFAKFLRPGGILLTIVPNMEGMIGWGQKMLSREVFDKHEVITRERLQKAHQEAGLSVIENDYFLFANFGVINPGDNPSIPKKVAFGMLKATTGFVWMLESFLGSMPPNRYTSPYILCVARLQ